MSDICDLCNTDKEEYCSTCTHLDCFSLKEEISVDALAKLISGCASSDPTRLYTDEGDIAKYLLKQLHIHPKEAQT